MDRVLNIRILVLDVDGVLTNNQLLFGTDGEIIKEFNSQDGLGITAAHLAGLKTAIITGRTSEMVRRRSEELKIGDLVQGSKDKVIALNEIIAKHGLSYNEVAYVGDDLNDLAVMAKVGLACAVANSVPEVKAIAHFTTVKAGGKGAVREVIEYILKAQTKWDWVVEQYKTTSAKNQQ